MDMHIDSPLELRSGCKGCPPGANHAPQAFDKASRTPLNILSFLACESM